MSVDDERTSTTLDAVARAAGVSRATASRVLTGSPRVSDSARDRVLRAADSLSYVPNGAARMLVTRRSDAIAFVVCEQEEKFFSDPFFATVLKGVHRVVSAGGRQLLFAVVACEDDRERLVRHAAGGHLDAAIFLSTHDGETAPARLRACGVPVVLAGRPPAGTGDLPHADTDNRSGGQLATEHLLARGRRRLGHITGPTDMVSSGDRLEGWRRTITDAGGHVGTDGGPTPVGALTGVVAVGDYTVAGGRRAMADLLERAPDLDGVFAANDLMAVGALNLLRERGRRVPDDVALVGYDDIPLATAVQPALTTVRQPLEELGREIAAMVMTTLDGAVAPASGARTPLTTQLVVRAST